MIENTSRGSGFLLGRVRNPSRRSSGRTFFHHSVDLFQSQTLGLVNEKVGVNETEKTKTTPEEEDFGTQVSVLFTDEVRSDNSDDTVPKPIGSGRQGDTSGSDGQGEDFSDNDPGTGSPSGSKEEDVDTDESDEDSGDGGVGRDGTGDGDDELTNDHTGGTPDKHGSSTESLNDEEGDGSGTDVDDGGDQGDQEGVADRSEGGEEDGTKVEDKVDTGPLLHHLHRGTEDGSSQVGSRVPEGTRETLGPTGKVTTGRDQSGLELIVGNDLSQFRFNVERVGGLVTDTGENGAGSVVHSLLDKVSGRLGQPEETTGKDDGPGELDANRDSVGTGVEPVLCCVIDTGCQQETNGDGELVTRHELSSNLSGSNLGHVENDDGRDETDTETGDQSTDNEQGDGRGSGLQYDTDGVDNTSDEGTWGWGYFGEDDCKYIGRRAMRVQSGSRQAGRTHPRITIFLLPNQSAKSPAMMAPKKVPADKIETIKDW